MGEAMLEPVIEVGKNQDGLPCFSLALPVAGPLEQIALGAAALVRGWTQIADKGDLSKFTPQTALLNAARDLERLLVAVMELHPPAKEAA